MKRVQTLLNTLYVLTQGSYLRLDHETVKIEIEGKTQSQVPLHHLGSIVCFGNVLVSSGLMARCAEDGRTIVLLDNNGQFRARVEGPVSGNVLLRRAQHETLSSADGTAAIARNIVAGKIQNARHVVLRGGRESGNPEESAILGRTARKLASCLSILSTCKDLEQIRGIEGDAARAYFETFNCLIKADRETFRFETRNRRPPRDPTNALLSFVYALLLNDCIGAIEGVGLDPQVGYLHALRPGRASLALDLMEELRPVIADRLTLTLINRRQITAGDFDERPGGAVYLNDRGRREVIVAYQKRKQEEIYHPVLERKIPIGLIPHIQARLLARFLRGDIEEYIPFLYR